MNKFIQVTGKINTATGPLPLIEEVPTLIMVREIEYISQLPNRTFSTVHLKSGRTLNVVEKYNELYIKIVHAES